eukprot:scaffold11560_cov51-Isochrysis_galbana.AAC.1
MGARELQKTEVHTTIPVGRAGSAARTGERDGSVFAQRLTWLKGTAAGSNARRASLTSGSGHQRVGRRVHLPRCPRTAAPNA